jgi:hypothetical protein
MGMQCGRVLVYRIRFLLVFLFTIVFCIFTPHSALTQWTANAPFTGLDLTPSNPLGLPGFSSGPARGSDTLNISSRTFSDMLPTIPGLEFSYLHSFAEGADWNKLLVEYVRPVRLNADTTVYGEIHGSFHNLFKSWSFYDRVDLSAGGGFRTRLGNDTVIGAHGFYDANRIGDSWQSSVSAGGIMAVMLPGNDAIDLTVNWYGGLATGSFTSGWGTWGNGTLEGTITYYHELWDEGPDLRLNFVGYDVGESRAPAGIRDRGLGSGMEIASRDGMFRGSYMYETDSVLGDIHTVAVNFNVGFRLESLLALESPFEKPTPIFSSPRTLGSAQDVSEGTPRHLAKEGSGFIRSACHYCREAMNTLWQGDWGQWYVDQAGGDCKAAISRFKAELRAGKMSKALPVWAQTQCYPFKPHHVPKCCDRWCYRHEQNDKWIDCYRCGFVLELNPSNACLLHCGVIP